LENETNVKDFGEIMTDEEWDARWRKLQARYDSRVDHRRGKDDKRRPSGYALLIVVGLVLMLASAGALTVIHVFAK